MSVPSLPTEIWREEIFRFIKEPSTTFVLRFVCRSFHEFFRGAYLEVNPIESFCERGYLNLVRWDRSEKPSSIISPRAFSLACQTGNLDLVKLLFPLTPIFDKNVLILAIKNKSYDVIRFLLENGATVSAEAYEEATDVASLKLLPGLKVGAKPSHERLVQLAALRGNSEIIDYFLQKLSPSHPDDVLAPLFAKAGRVDLLKLYKCKPDAALYSAAFDDDNAPKAVNVLNWLFENNVALSNYEVLRIAMGAITSGNMELFEWLAARQSSNPFAKLTNVDWRNSIQYSNADDEKLIAILKYAITFGVALNAAMVEGAITGRHLTLFKWLDGHGLVDQVQRAKMLPQYIKMKDVEFLKTLTEQDRPLLASNNPFSPDFPFGDYDIEFYRLLDSRNFLSIFSNIFAKSQLSKMEEIEELFAMVSFMETYFDSTIFKILSTDKVNIHLLEFFRHKGNRVREPAEFIWGETPEKYFSLDKRVVTILTDLGVQPPKAKKPAKLP